MCETCGCEGDGAVVRNLPNGEHVHVYPDGRVVTHSHAHVHEHGHAHVHEHGHAHAHEHGHAHAHEHGHEHEHEHEHEPMHGAQPGHPHEHGDKHEHVHHAPQPEVGHQRGVIREPVQVKVLARNRALAERNRELMQQLQVFAFNLMSSPGAGKTTLLTRTLPELLHTGPAFVIEGDQATALDAHRIAQTGVPVVQVNTGKGCHLEADMIFAAVQQLAPAPGALLVIENVGNLVCPALFDLGEGKRIVLLSVTEGDDKPEKYPHMFTVADLVVLTKIDLLPHVDFDVARARTAVSRLNPKAEWLELSAKTGAGMPDWLAWLEAQRPTALSSTRSGNSDPRHAT